MSDELRLWSGQNGKYQVKTSYVCLFQDKKVKLRKPNGALIAVPLNILCKADIAFVSMQSQFVVPQQHENNSLRIPSPLFIVSYSSSSSSSSSSGTSSSCWNESVPSLKPPSLNSTEELPLQEIIPGVQPNVRPLSFSESNLMLPKRSLSSLVQQLSIRHSLITEAPLHLTNLPTNILTHIMSFLDVRSRLTLATLNRHLHSSNLKPSVWKEVYFEKRKEKKNHDQVVVNDGFIRHLILYLQQHHLDKHITHVILDNTMITAKSTIRIIQNLRNIHTLSLQSCWKVYIYDLAVEFKNMSYSNHHFSRISKVMIGKILDRGPVVSHGHCYDILESKSFGQDIWFINSALNRLTRKNVSFDVQFCQTCCIGTVSQLFKCGSCGTLPLKNYLPCAPGCDRCSLHFHDLPDCNKS